jgi:CheY-like chemotaxis protein
MNQPKKKILLIDDEADLIDIFKFCIERKPYDVDTATSGSEGINYLHTNKYDLVITDLKMPQVTGVEVLDVANKTKTPIMITTAYTKEYTTDIPSDVRIVRKPFNIEELLEEIDIITK